MLIITLLEILMFRRNFQATRILWRVVSNVYPHQFQQTALPLLFPLIADTKASISYLLNRITSEPLSNF